jgi:hypothetical protein
MEGSWRIMQVGKSHAGQRVILSPSAALSLAGLAPLREPVERDIILFSLEKVSPPAPSSTRRASGPLAVGGLGNPFSLTDVYCKFLFFPFGRCIKWIHRERSRPLCWNADVRGMRRAAQACREEKPSPPSWVPLSNGKVRSASEKPLGPFICTRTTGCPSAAR